MNGWSENPDPGGRCCYQDPAGFTETSRQGRALVQLLRLPLSSAASAHLHNVMTARTGRLLSYPADDGAVMRRLAQRRLGRDQSA